MQNQYFGDVNDYVKYGLLRCFSDAGWRVGVCWMRRPDDGRGDGGKTHYLSHPQRWRKHDPFLFDALNRTVGAGAPRSISIVETGTMIPKATFFSDFIPDSRSARSTWLATALAALSECDLLFFDPDNGLEVSSKPFGSSGSSKHLYWSEIQPAWEQRASLLIFQHFTRENRESYTGRLVTKLQQEVPTATTIPLRTANVLFLLACQPEHASRGEAALQLVRSRWKGIIDYFHA